MPRLPLLPVRFAALLVSATVVCGLCALGAGAAESECYSDWSVAAPIVEHEGLMPVEKLTAAARKHLKGEIVKTTLCKDQGSYVFRLVVRGAGGKLNPVTVDAKAPFGD